MYRAINPTFMALIPTTDKPESWNYFRLISLCNFNIYKIIANIISKRIKGVLSRRMSKEQFGFLDERQILDAIVTT